MSTSSSSATSVKPSGNRRLLGLLALIAAVVVGIDQATKFWAQSALTDRDAISVLGEFIQFRLLYNSGAAFSMASGMTWLLTLIAAGVVVVLVRVSRRIGSRGWTVALGLLLGGAVGNLLDRLFRDPGFPQGHVVDFIDYNGWFVGNVADIAVFFAAAMIVVLSLRGIGLDGDRTR